MGDGRGEGRGEGYEGEEYKGRFRSDEMKVKECNNAIPRKITHIRFEITHIRFEITHIRSETTHIRKYVCYLPYRTSLHSNTPMYRAPVSRSLAYNQTNRITRIARGVVAIPCAGFQIGPSQFQAVQFAFSLNGVSMFGNSTSFEFFPIPNAAEIAAL